MQEVRHGKGQRFKATDIAEGHPLKRGPWFCAGDGCSVQFKYHRAGGYVSRGESRTRRQASFVHSDERDHAPDCEFNELAERQRLLNAHGSVLSKRGETLLLRYRRDEGPRESGPTPEPRGAGAVRERYAAVMETALDITKVVDRIGESALTNYWVRHQGTNYTWAEFSYGPEASDLERLTPSVKGQFTSGVWPRIARAMVADMRGLNEAGTQIVVRMRAEDKLPDGSYVRFWVFAAPNSEAGEALLALRDNQRCAVLGHAWAFMDGTQLAGITIESAAQITVLR